MATDNSLPAPPRAYLVPRRRRTEQRSWAQPLPTSGTWKVTGEAGSGVSSFLIDTVVRAVESGADPRGILVISSSKESGARLRVEDLQRRALEELSLEPEQLLAEYRQLPALTGLHKVELADGTLQGTRDDARGTWELEAPLPAIVTVNDKSDKPRFPNFKGLMAAKKAEITTLTLSDLGIEAIAPTTSGRVTDPERFSTAR